MNTEEKNRKIAEAYNWTRLFHYHGNGPLWGMSPHNRFDRVPDHFSDLNAMHEAEAGVGLHDRANLALRVKWVNALREVVSRQCPKNHVGAALVSDIDLLNASASDRAEAFGLTLNLWTS